MNIIMQDQRRPASYRAERRERKQENRNMAKFIGKVVLLLVLATCASQWFLV